jgi:hypothetical protein
MRHLHNSNMERNQITLFGVVVREWDYDFLGVFSGSELGIPGGFGLRSLKRLKLVLFWLFSTHCIFWVDVPGNTVKHILLWKHLEALWHLTIPSFESLGFLERPGF